MAKLIDMTGWIMAEHGVPESQLTILEYVGTRQWKCKCSCGTIVILDGSNIRSGNTKSCGCLATKRRQEENAKRGTQVHIGDTFGKLTVIKDLGYRKQTSRNKQWRWSLCQCSCGSAPIEVANALLVNHHISSCGCITSYGETIIRDILIQNNITFKEQYSFIDLLGPNNGKLRFDFAIFNNNKLQFLIEFDGKYHYQPAIEKWQSYYSLEDIQNKDKQKNEYCIKNNILLKRIPYTQINNISLQTIFDSTFNFILNQ